MLQERASRHTKHECLPAEMLSVCSYDPFRGFLRAIDTYVVTEFADDGHIKIILFNWCAFLPAHMYTGC